MDIQHTHQEINSYCAEQSMGLSQIAQELYEYTREHVPRSMMLIGPLEAAFLKFLLGSIQAKNVLEIGTFTGFSALIMAEALGPEGRVTTIDINQETTTLAKKYWKKAQQDHKIDARVAPALEVIDSLQEQFDFIFIDADKQNYIRYFDIALSKVSSGGIIAIDNCLWSGSVLADIDKVDPEDISTLTIKELNTRVSEDPSLECVLAPIRDGIMLVRKRGFLDGSSGNSRN